MGVGRIFGRGEVLLLRWARCSQVKVVRRRAVQCEHADPAEARKKGGGCRGSPPLMGTCKLVMRPSSGLKESQGFLVATPTLADPYPAGRAPKMGEPRRASCTGSRHPPFRRMSSFWTFVLLSPPFWGKMVLL